MKKYRDPDDDIDDGDKPGGDDPGQDPPPLK